MQTEVACTCKHITIHVVTVEPVKLYTCTHTKLSFSSSVPHKGLSAGKHACTYALSALNRYRAKLFIIIMAFEIGAFPLAG